MFSLAKMTMYRAVLDMNYGEISRVVLNEIHKLSPNLATYAPCSLLKTGAATKRLTPSVPPPPVIQAPVKKHKSSKLPLNISAFLATGSWNLISLKKKALQSCRSFKHLFPTQRECF